MPQSVKRVCAGCTPQERTIQRSVNYQVAWLTVWLGRTLLLWSQQQNYEGLLGTKRCVDPRLLPCYLFKNECGFDELWTDISHL